MLSPIRDLADLAALRFTPDKRALGLTAVLALALSSAPGLAGLDLQGDSGEKAVKRCGVKLFEHASFRGRGQVFYSDDPDLRDNGIGDNQASSAEVLPGSTVTLYGRPNYRGQRTVLYVDEADLGTREVGNDRVSSLQVRCEPPAAPETLAAESLFEAALSDLTRRQEESAEVASLKKRTVMITVTFDDQSVEHGAGALLCREDSRSYILTARHLLFGKRSADGSLPDRRPVRSEITFFQNNLPTIVHDWADGDNNLTVHQMPERELAVLSFPDQGESWSEYRAWHSLTDSLTGGSGAASVRPVEWTRDVERDRPAVLAVGYRESSRKRWVAQWGALLPGEGYLIYHSAPLVEGFSGGPLFHASGPLLGIHLETVAGEAIGAEAGSFYSKAISVEDILPSVGSWLPPKCRQDFVETLLPHRLLAAADKLEAVWPYRDLRFHFGPYRVTYLKVLPIGPPPFHGVWRRTGISLDEGNGRLWDGECTETRQGRISVSRTQRRSTLHCAFQRPGGEEAVDISFEGREGRAERRGQEGSTSALRISASGTRPDVWNLLHAEGGPFVGAIHDDTIWLGPSLVGKTRSTAGLASAVLLAFSETYMPDAWD